MKTHAARGMTLLEITAVLAIIAVLTSISLWGMQTMLAQKRELGAARELEKQLWAARQLALTSNQPVRMRVNTAVENGEAITRARWTRVPCADAWGYTCPAPACSGASCTDSGGGCVCAELGDAVKIPPTMNADALDGLCFVAGSGAPRGMDCDAASAAVESVSLTLSELPPLIFSLEPLTGRARLVDCGTAGSDGGVYSLCP